MVFQSMYRALLTLIADLTMIGNGRRGHGATG